jgi:leucyl-tRNA synthetase
MPGSAGSSWYFLRYIDPHNNNEFANYELLKHWMPVDLYIGGSEHAVGHLLYSRFWTNYLYDKGLCPVKEPFKKLVHQGMILGENNEKMSKSRGNVVNPDDVIEKYGADTLRLYEMFMGPLDASLPWNGSNLEGSRKFLDRVWRLFTSEEYTSRFTNEYNKELEKIYHKTVKKVTNDYESLAFNTAISQLMIFINEAYKAKQIYIGFLEGFIKLLYPICPHIGEELWEMLGHTNTITYESFPTYEEEKTKDDVITIVISINGKVRDKLEVEPGLDKDTLLKLAFESEKVNSFINGKEILKTIVVPNKLINIVIKG